MAFQYGLLQCHTNPSQVENLPGKSSGTNMLFDCGNSQNRVLRNAEITGINLPTIDVIMPVKAILISLQQV